MAGFLSAGSAGVSLHASEVTVDPVAAAVTEAANRFAIPEQWIRAVLAAESAGDPAAVSPKGAIGLMQIMPATWHELRLRHRLGPDPFDIRDNILAGSAYLRELHDRFGSPGFLAAYNAGPARYEASLATGKPLPDETRAYVAGLTAAIGIDGLSITLGPHPGVAPASPTPTDWRNATLFVTPSSPSAPAPHEPKHEPFSVRTGTADGSANNTAARSMFPPRSPHQGGQR